MNGVFAYLFITVFPSLLGIQGFEVHGIITMAVTIGVYGINSGQRRFF